MDDGFAIRTLFSGFVLSHIVFFKTLPLTAHTGGNLPLTSEETTSVPPAPAPPSVQTFEPNWADKYSVYSWPIMWSSALHKSGNFQQGDNPLHVQYDPEADKILEKRPVRGLGLFSSSLSGWMPFHVRAHTSL